MLPRTTSIWQRDSQPYASGKPGAVQKAGAKTADLARRHGVSEATIYNCKAKDGGLVSEAKRLRACRVIGADRKSMRYRSQREDDADLRSKLRELAQQRRRFGDRRLHILLRREGVVINRKKTQRLYSEEKLAVRRRRNRRRAIGAQAPAPVLARPNQRWNLDFVHDQLATGRRVVRELTDLIAERGKPGMIVSDNGTELTSNAVLA